MLERMSLREALDRAERKAAARISRERGSSDPLLALRPAFSFAVAAADRDDHAGRRLQERVKL